jgi:bisanhydrobacterioruberin hydratase
MCNWSAVRNFPQICFNNQSNLRCCERPVLLNSSSPVKTSIVLYSSIVLLVFHIIGFGLFVTNPENAALSWLNILLCGVVVFICEGNASGKWVTFAVIAVAGFVIELIGTQTGWLFGNYYYGQSLGLKLLGVPLAIGLNWYAIVLAASNVARLVSIPKILQALLGGLLATMLDVIIEPAAIHYDFWDWRTGAVPVFNYFCWFVFSALFSYFYLRRSTKLNITAIVLFVIWGLFFSALIFI